MAVAADFHRNSLFNLKTEPPELCTIDSYSFCIPNNSRNDKKCQHVIAWNHNILLNYVIRRRFVFKSKIGCLNLRQPLKLLNSAAKCDGFGSYQFAPPEQGEKLQILANFNKQSVFIRIKTTRQKHFCSCRASM